MKYLKFVNKKGEIISTASKEEPRSDSSKISLIIRMPDTEAEVISEEEFKVEDQRVSHQSSKGRSQQE